jgi:hypothetical protein
MSGSKDQQLRGAIEQLLPIRERNSLPQLSPTEIADVIRHLSVEGGSWRRRDASPRSKTVALQKSADELRRVASAAASLHDALASLHQPSAGVFHNIESLIRTARTVQIIAEGAAEEPPSEVSASRYRDSSHDPEERLAVLAAHIFRDLTGSMPARRTKEQGGVAYGPFHDFLSAVFKARGVTGSPENHAKIAIKAMEKNKPDSRRKLL